MGTLTTTKALNQAWTTLTLFMVFVSVNILAVVQWKIPGGVVVLPTSVFDKVARESILYLGIPVVAVMLFFSVKICNEYLRVTESLGSHWSKRVPILFNLDLKEIRRSSPMVARFWSGLVFVILVVPLIINIQQLHKFLVEDIKAIHRESGREVSIFQPDWPTVIFFDEYRYGSHDGFTFWPVYTPIIFLALELFLVAYVARYLVRIYRLLQTTAD